MTLSIVSVHSALSSRGGLFGFWAGTGMFNPVYFNRTSLSVPHLYLLFFSFHFTWIFSILASQWYLGWQSMVCFFWATFLGRSIYSWQILIPLSVAASGSPVFGFVPELVLLWKNLFHPQYIEVYLSPSLTNSSTFQGFFLHFAQKNSCFFFSFIWM